MESEKEKWPATFARAEEMQLRDMLKLTPAQRLALAEEMLQFMIEAGVVKKYKQEV